MRIGLISGIHEDVIRLREAITLLQTQHCDRVACLGDIVGYSVPYYGFFASRNAHQAIETVKAHCHFVVAGNHDLFAVRKIPTHQAIFDYPENWYTLDYWTRQELALDQIFLYEDDLPALLTRTDEVYLASLPEYFVIQFDNISVMLSHYAYPDLVGDSQTFDPAEGRNIERHFAFMRQHQCQLGLSGHGLQEGVEIYTGTGVQSLPFGTYSLSKEMTWLHGPWVANGTNANGVMILDTLNWEIEILPLDTPRHVVPAWYYL